MATVIEEFTERAQRCRQMASELMALADADPVNAEDYRRRAALHLYDAEQAEIGIKLHHEALRIPVLCANGGDYV